MESLYWRKILSIPIPALYVTSCTFGGPNLTDLYITTARTRMTDDELKSIHMLVVFFEFKQMLKAVPPIHFAIKILGLKQYEPYRIHKTRRKEISRPLL